MKVDVYTTERKMQFIVVEAGKPLPESVKHRAVKKFKAGIDLDGNRDGMIGANPTAIRAAIEKDGYAEAGARVETSEVVGGAVQKNKSR